MFPARTSAVQGPSDHVAPIMQHGTVLKDGLGGKAGEAVSCKAGGAGSGASCSPTASPSVSEGKEAELAGATCGPAIVSGAFLGPQGDVSVAGDLASEVPRPPSSPSVDVQGSSNQGPMEENLPQFTGLRSPHR